MDNLEKYQYTIRENLFINHKCPYEFTNQILEKYSDVVKAMHDSSIPAVTLVRWFYLEWHVQHAQLQKNRQLTQ